MSKFNFNKKQLEDTWESGKEKVSEQIKTVKKINFGKSKIFFLILLLIILLGLGFYYNIIQNIFYSFLSVIVVILVLSMGIAWEYSVLTYVPLREIPHFRNEITDPWKALEREFEIVKRNSEQKIKQIKRYSVLNYMTSIGLFIFACIVLLIDWMYNKASSLSPYQDVNPAFILCIVLLFFSLLFMLLHYLNQKDISKNEEKASAMERWILSIKSAHLLGKDHIIEDLLSGKNIKDNIN